MSPPQQDKPASYSDGLFPQPPFRSSVLTLYLPKANLPFHMHRGYSPLPLPLHTDRLDKLRPSQRLHRPCSSPLSYGRPRPLRSQERIQSSGKSSKRYPASVRCRCHAHFGSSAAATLGSPLTKVLLGPRRVRGKSTCTLDRARSQQRMRSSGWVGHKILTSRNLCWTALTIHIFPHSQPPAKAFFGAW